MKETTKERIVLYDWIRVAAIILVVIGHASYTQISTYYGAVDYVLPTSLNSHYEDAIFRLIRYIGSKAYGFHMPLFFVLAGCTYAIREAKNLDALIRSKFFRLIVPYYAYGLLFMIPVKRMGDFYKGEKMPYILRDFIKGGGECGHLWFLITLFSCFILSYFLIKYVYVRSKYLALLIALLCVYVSTDSLPAYMGFSNSFQYIIWFVLGYMYEKDIRKRLDALNTPRHMLITLGLMVVSYTLDRFVKAGPSIIIFAKCALFIEMCVLLSRLFAGARVMNDFIANLAALSIYIYIFHDPLNYIILKYAFLYNWLSNGTMVYLYYALRIIGVILVSVIFGECISMIKRSYYSRKKAKAAEGGQSC